MIRLERLHVTAGSFSLRIDELSVEKGEFLVILGPTGSGKTVLLEAVAGLRRPRGGRIWFGDRDVTLEPPERRRAGFVYQDYALFPHLTVSGNIAFGLHASAGRRRAWIGRSAADRGRVASLASLLGIEQLLDRYPIGLSGGEQQRVALARALAIEPDILLLDEPLSALDRQTRGEMRVEIKRLQRDLSATVLHVTHDLDEALALGNRMAVLIDGGLRQLGIPSDVIRHPVDAEVARLLGLTNVFLATWNSDDSGEVRIRLRSRPGSLGGAGSDAAVELVVDPGLVTSSGDTFVAVIRPEEIGLLGPVEDPAGGVASAGGIRAGEMPENLMEGTIRSIQLQSVHASLEIDVPPLFAVNVLRPDVTRMGLEVGSRVRLRVPRDAVHICPGSSVS
jgi:molybdate/tungstate transport system ATP-binding protein